MVSTEPSVRPPADAGATSARSPQYIVPDWVRVREEDFGLLFYDTHSTRLTFVRSGRELIAPPFTGPRRFLGVRGSDNSPDPAVLRLLKSLLAKGLIVAEAE